MIRSLLKRLVHALFLLGIISIIAFGLSKLVPGDEIQDYLSIDDSKYSASSNPLAQRTAYAKVAANRGLDLPVFYISVLPGYYPKGLHSIVPSEDRKTVEQWTKASKNKEASLQLYHRLLEGLQYTCPKGDTSSLANQVCLGIHSILHNQDLFSTHHTILRLHAVIEQHEQRDSGYIQIINNLNAGIEKLVKAPKKLSLAEWLPSVYWHGSQNQYHRWLTGFITFKPVTSLIDGRNAWTKILDALQWTLLLNGLAFIFAIVLGIWIGMWSATHDGSRIERWLNIKLFALYALPSFWLATLLIYLLSSGEWFSIFPAGGLGPYHTAGSFFSKWGILLTHLTLPVLCLALGSLAYVSRQMKQSVMHQFTQPYVLSLRTLGVSEKTILRQHVFRNALFPMITMIGGALPALLSGSLIIEVIFSIPGMGRLLYSSLMARDWPVVFPILMFSAGITVFAYIMTDIIYKWADPRVKSMES